MVYVLDIGNGHPPIPCRDAHQALLLARLWVAFTTGAPAEELPAPSQRGDNPRDTL